jgi:hypothetical protein
MNTKLLFHISGAVGALGGGILAGVLCGIATDSTGIRFAFGLAVTMIVVSVTTWNIEKNYRR